ncbi:hypothetical protein KC367_g5640 [Hortaea werneckii]|nr:hypothetical protein KC356_g5034 [Hortaea werneckii]KAI7497761.1 hypothetical protein KC367_g5640 [Hortaea werneckii]
MVAIRDIEKLPSSLEDDRAGTTINNSYGPTGVNGVNYGKFNMGNEYGGDHNEYHGPRNMSMSMQKFQDTTNNHLVMNSNQCGHVTNQADRIIIEGSQIIHR